MGHTDIQRKGAPHWRVHPGEILREEFLKPLGISAYELAKRLHVPAPRINDIVLERRGISADTAVRLSRFFGTTGQFWLNLLLWLISSLSLRTVCRDVTCHRARLIIQRTSGALIASGHCFERTILNLW